jgi:hypothetical protein
MVWRSGGGAKKTVTRDTERGEGMDLRDTGEAKLIGLGWMCGLRGRIPALQL